MSEEGYEIGYGKPPKSGQFKKGKSGNPKGRPKGTRNLSADLKEELAMRIVTKEGDRVQKLSKQRALVKTLTNKALNGDQRAIATLVKLIERLLTDAEEEVEDVPLSKADQQIIAEFLKRNSHQSSKDKDKEND
jgi:hypothetical protein